MRGRERNRLALGEDEARPIPGDLKGQGLGRLLLEKLIRYCRERGIGELRGSVLLENTAMLRLAHSLGFRVRGTEQNVAEIAVTDAGRLLLRNVAMCFDRYLGAPPPATGPVPLSRAV